MNVRMMAGVGAGVAIGASAVAASAATRDLPESPGVVTPRELLAGAQGPLVGAAVLGTVVSLARSSSAGLPGDPNGWFAGGAVLGALGAGAILAGLWSVGQMRDR
jgi:hypothetical protein